MTLRTRLTLAATIAAAVAALGVALIGITCSRHQLRTEVDAGLRREVARLDFQRLIGNPKVGRKGGGAPDRGGNLAVRAEQHGGTFRLDQGEPNGTTATWSIPVPVPAQ